jgi:hypothetical protein
MTVVNSVKQIKTTLVCSFHVIISDRKNTTVYKVHTLMDYPYNHEQLCYVHDVCVCARVCVCACVRVRVCVCVIQ